jgi:hypothetical protein
VLLNNSTELKDHLMTFLRSWFVSGVVLAAIGAQASPALAQAAIPAPGSES